MINSTVAYNIIRRTNAEAPHAQVPHRYFGDHVWHNHGLMSLEVHTCMCAHTAHSAQQTTLY